MLTSSFNNKTTFKYWFNKIYEDRWLHVPAVVIIIYYCISTPRNVKQLLAGQSALSYRLRKRHFRFLFVLFYKWISPFNGFTFRPLLFYFQLYFLLNYLNNNTVYGILIKYCFKLAITRGFCFPPYSYFCSLLFFRISVLPLGIELRLKIQNGSDFHSIISLTWLE